MAKINFKPNFLFFWMIKKFLDNRHALDPALKDAENPDGKPKRITFFNLGGTRCFGKDQLIVSKNGSKRISELKKGDLVLSYNHKKGINEYKKVINVVKNENNSKECYEIRLKNGRVIKCTTDHEFYTNGEYKPIKEILEKWFDDDLKQDFIDGLKLDSIDTIKHILLDETYDLTVNGNSNYLLDCGIPILVHNSSKTYDEIHFIWKLCDSNRNCNLYIAVYRETLVKCRDTTLKDFKECFNRMNLVRDKDYTLVGDTNGRPIISLYGNTIEFKGFPEEGAEGGRIDIAFFNEIFEIDNQRIFNNICQRVEKIVICDANPSLTSHWSMERKQQFNTFYSTTTYLDNEHLTPQLKADYEGWCPWDFKDSHLEFEDGYAQFDGFKKRVWDKPECPDNVIDEPYPNNKYRLPNEHNLEMKTADKWRWLVYGEGIPAAREGSIFPDVQWVKHFGEEYDEVVWGCDLGYTKDHTTLSRIGRNGMRATIECVVCQPTNTPEITFDLFEKQFLSLGLKDEQVWVCCESQDRYGTEVWVDSLNQLANTHGYNWNFFKISKKSILAGVSIMKKFQLSIVESEQAHIRDRFRLEQQNYMYRVINDASTNEPDPTSKFCDIWDGVRYAFQHFFYWATENKK